jgi:branched-subunit amino acid aminotransferase/4-amino-4-deoxychorismate lyase
VRRRPGWETDPSRVLIETPRKEYCLNGITRALVLRFAREFGFEINDRADLLPMDFLGREREVFMTGTAAGVMPVVKITDHAVADGRPGPITRRFQEQLTAAMDSEEFGLPVNATEAQADEYLLSPGILNHAEVEEQFA